jgi:AcrR family transcriptional regulator
MATEKSETTVVAQRPQRADARRNYEALITAARDAFAQDGTSASLEDIARRAGVGIGTLYRHFPTRQALLEAVYLEEVEEACRVAQEMATLPPWDALAGWLRHFVGFAASKRALAQALMAYLDADAEVFGASRGAITAAGEPLLARAQEAGVARPDARFMDVVRMVSGIAVIPAVDPEQIERILDLALDGLRYRAPGD